MSTVFVVRGLGAEGITTKIRSNPDYFPVMLVCIVEVCIEVILYCGLTELQKKLYKAILSRDVGEVQPMNL